PEGSWRLRAGHGRPAPARLASETPGPWPARPGTVLHRRAPDRSLPPQGRPAPASGARGAPGLRRGRRGGSGGPEALRASWWSQGSSKLLVVAEDAADVRLRLGVIRHAAGLADRPGPGVVGGHGEVDAAKTIELTGEVAGSPIEVGDGIGRVDPEAGRRAGHQLGQTDGPRTREGSGVEAGLGLRDGGKQPRVDARLRGCRIDGTGPRAARGGEGIGPARRCRTSPG